MGRYTLEEGRLELDEGAGSPGGPRIVDRAAGKVLYAEGHGIRFRDLRAIAVVYTEREVWQHRDGRRDLVKVMRHSVVLLREPLPRDLEPIIAAIEREAPLPSGFSMYGTAVAVDEASVHFTMSSGASDARATAKDVARLAGLPMVELCGESPMYRPAGALDLSLQRRLAEHPVEDPGAPPAGLTVNRDEGGLEIAFVRASPPKRPALTIAALVVPVDVLLLLVSPLVGGICTVLTLGLLGFLLAGHKPQPSRLTVSGSRACWTVGEAEEPFDLETLEMIRVVDATLVFVRHRDETRIDLGDASLARWVRQAIEHHLSVSARAAG